MSYEVKIEVCKIGKAHEDAVVSEVIFVDSPHDLIVSGGNDMKIGFWESRTLKHISFNEEHEGHVYQLMQWDDDKIMSLSNSEIRIIRLIPDFPRYKVEKVLSPKDVMINDSEFVKLLKISHELLLIVLYETMIIASVSDDGMKVEMKNKIVLIDDNFHVHFYSYPRLSSFYPECFYLNVMNKTHSALLIDFSEHTEVGGEFTGKIIKDFEHPNSLNFIHTHLNSKGNEILICGGDDSILYVYCSSFPDIPNSLVSMVKVKEDIYSLNSISSKNFEYIFVGGSDGNLSLFEITEGEVKLIAEEKIQEQRVYNQAFISKKKKSTGIEIVTCCGTGSVNKVRITGLPLDEDEIENDLRERIEYLKDQVVEDHVNHFCIKIENVNVFLPFKFLLEI